MIYKSPPNKKTELLEKQNGDFGSASTPAEGKSAEVDALLMVIEATTHELNQPLTTVLGLSELLLSQVEPNSSQAEDLTAMVKELRRMNEIVRGLKLLAHYQTKKQFLSTH